MRGEGKRAWDPSMPVRLVGQSIDMHPGRGRLAGKPLPTAAAVAVCDRDLEAVGRKPARMIVVLVAIATTTAGTSDRDLSGFEIAHNGIRAGIRRRRVLADVRDVASVR